MKTRLLVPLVGLAISFAFPNFAQEQNAVDPEVRQQIEDAYKKRLDAYNKQDAAAVARMRGVIKTAGPIKTRSESCSSPAALFHGRIHERRDTQCLFP